MVNRSTPLDKNQGDIWHPGELELQRRIGAIEHMAKVGKRVIRNYMLEQHREFFAQLPFIMVGTIDNAGNPWAGLRVGEPGFITSPNPKQLQITGSGLQDDPMEVGLKNDVSIGLLGIELSTRRRNRMNGHISHQSDKNIQIEVDQSFGNCPQYIQARQVVTTINKPAQIDVLTKLDENARTQIAAADTFFVTTYADLPDRRQVDISHRGGHEGFIALETDGALTIPDFSGNHFFATLGNILLNGRAGLVFIDFTDGTLLQMTGRAENLQISNKTMAFQGAERFWRFWPERIVRRHRALPLRFEFEDFSPNLLLTGNWDHLAAHHNNEKPDNS